MRLKNLLLYIGSLIPAALVLTLSLMMIPRTGREADTMYRLTMPRRTVSVGQILTGKTGFYFDSNLMRELDEMKKGTLVEVIDEGEEWYQVKYKGTKGYVCKDCIEKVEMFDWELFIRPVVVLDAGHQYAVNKDTEAIGPMEESVDPEKEGNKKPKMDAGYRGISTNVSEAEFNLKIALLLEEELKKRGYTVIQVRRSQDVDISYAERGKIANEMGADVFIRLHMNNSHNTEENGAQTVCLKEDNPYTSGIYKQSHRLSECILDAYTAETECEKKEIYETNELTELNWCEVPVTILKMGYMSNPDEDERMQTVEYQRKMVKGIADGIDNYFAEENNLGTEKR